MHHLLGQVGLNFDFMPFIYAQLLFCLGFPIWFIEALALGSVSAFPPRPKEGAILAFLGGSFASLAILLWLTFHCEFAWCIIPHIAGLIFSMGVVIWAVRVCRRQAKEKIVAQLTEELLRENLPLRATGRREDR